MQVSTTIRARSAAKEIGRKDKKVESDKVSLYEFYYTERLYQKGVEMASIARVRTLR